MTTPDIPIITDMRKLPICYRAFCSLLPAPNAGSYEAALQSYRDWFKVEPGRITFYAAPDGKLNYYVIEDLEDE